MTTTPPATPKPRPRWRQFSLRTQLQAQRVGGRDAVFWMLQPLPGGGTGTGKGAGSGREAGTRRRLGDNERREWPGSARVCLNAE